MARVIFTLLMLVSVAKAQLPTITGYTKVNSRYSWMAGNFGDGLHVPQYNGVPTDRTGVWMADGAIAVDTLNSRFYVRFNGVWTAFTPGAASWSLLGNASTVAGTHFVGTTDAVDLVFKRNSTEIFRAGSVGLDMADNFYLRGNFPGSLGAYANLIGANDGDAVVEIGNPSLGFRISGTTGNVSARTQFVVNDNTTIFSPSPVGWINIENGDATANNFASLNFNDGTVNGSGMYSIFSRTNNGGDLHFWTRNNSGTAADRAVISGTGAFRLNSYGAGTFTGTPTRYLQVDASGNVIEGSTSVATPISSLTAATAGNTINNANNSQIWQWNSLSGIGLTLQSNTTAAAGGSALLYLESTGANASSGITQSGIVITNNHSGTTSTNIGANINVAGATTNYGVLSTASASATTNIGGSFSASGATTNNAINIAAGALTLNNSAGTSGQVLTSAGANTLPTWETPAVTASNTVTLTNKRWTARVGSTTSSGTPTINTDNVDIYKLTAQAADITSFTTNLSGTPVDGDILEIQITGTAARAITWGASFVSSTVTLPATTVTTATLTVILQYYTTSSYGNNKWVCASYY